MEQFAKIKVVFERTYLVPLLDGKSYNGNTAEETRAAWFGDVDALNTTHFARDNMRLGGADKIISSEIFEIVDIPDGTL